MCLGIPAKVIEIKEDNTGKVDYLGTKIKVNFSLIDDIKVGDYVILHAGFAISKLDEKEVEETLSLLKDFIENK
ncbi:HypC/HybG/HupF family hydrogenase formation chaperone [SCandidatus Aminicenantes bacterium Aminicenantia_JdfR_composite]|jgi:hydrogenase expression/formation protein HypC|nr:HypC/HybG/HupF family hydrogenase formation chaperone [SCandidatus Aminicenantes bacterium Aminicenantia_JdfR_composite]